MHIFLPFVAQKNSFNLSKTAVVQIMRETLIYLSHLDHEDTEQQV